MKLWQIMNVLSDEKDIFQKYFHSYRDFQQDIPQDLVINAFGQSKKVFLVTDMGYLRLNLPNDGITKSVETLSVLEAYKRFGGDAINEVIDYGSFNIGK